MASAPVALVTGGAQGIGRATAQTLLEAGYRVVIADIDRAAGIELVAGLAAGDAVRFVPADISQQAAVTELVAAALTAYGRLDCLVNNAGINCIRPLAELSLEDWQRVIGVNLTGAMLCSKQAAPHLAAAKGSIINIASTRAHMSEPHTEAYAASKDGLLALTLALAISLGPEVQVNCVSPGWIDVSAWRKGAPQGETLRPEATPSIPPAASAVRKTSQNWSVTLPRRPPVSSPDRNSSSTAA